MVKYYTYISPEYIYIYIYGFRNSISSDTNHKSQMITEDISSDPRRVCLTRMTTNSVSRERLQIQRLYEALKLSKKIPFLNDKLVILICSY